MFRFSVKRCYFSCMGSMISCCLLVGLPSQFRCLYFLFFFSNVFDGVWCSLCCCLMIITLLFMFCVYCVLLFSSVVLFMPNTHHVVARHPSCSCCFLVFIVLFLINVHHVATITLHS